jgi:signal transduction protein with GAF and PtsI domain
VRNSVLECPIIIKGGKLVGVLCVEHIGFASNRRQWSSEEQEFLVQLSAFVGEFVESMATSMVKRGLNDLVPEILLPNQPLKSDIE